MAQPKYPVRALLKPIVNWFGRLGRKNAPSVSVKVRTTASGTSQTFIQQSSDSDLWDMFFTPYVWAGLRFRDISRLWTGASPTKNEQGQMNSPAQIQALDLDGNEADSDQLQAVRWLFDNHLKEGAMAQTLKEISYAKLILKKSVHEILWTKATEGEYKGKLVIDGFRHVDPTLFEFNPEGYDEGLYVKKVNKYGIKTTDFEQVDERRFLVMPNLPLFADKNGISALESLRDAEKRRADAEKYWGRGAQRHGSGHIIGSYGPELLGNSGKTDRDNFQTMLENIAGDTVSMKYVENLIEELNVDVDADVFMKFIDELKTQISLVLTGSPLTLKEGKFGSRSMAESTQVRQESNLEQQDAAEISAAFTVQVIRRFCDFNWIQTDVYPKMQLISEEQNAPTTPQSQDTLIDQQREGTGQQQPIQKESKLQSAVYWKKDGTPIGIAYDRQGNWLEIPVENVVKDQTKKLIKLQAGEEEEPKEGSPPVAIPAGYESFPNDTPLSENVRAASDYAKDILTEMPVKDYETVQPGETPFVFTVKRFRNYTSDMLPILNDMKAAIGATLDENSEKDAWEAYYDLLVPILKERDIDITPQIRNDLNISFRQARQNVFGEAMYQRALDTPGIVGLRIVNRPADKHHVVHTYWDNIAIPKNHPELQRGGRLRIPMDFGCICEYEYVYDTDALTAEADMPSIYPGDTYRYYAQPATREPEAQE